MANYWIPGQLYLTKIIILLSTVSRSFATDSSGEVKSQGVVCYDGLGCFKPFATAPNMPLPMTPGQIHTKFELYTAADTKSEKVINASRTSFDKSTFDATKETKIIVHGFALMQKDRANWVSKMTQSIMANDDVNVIVVDWCGGAAVAYDQAVANTRLVGAQIAQIIRTLMEIYGYDPSDVHIIGFSLGAHVSGFAGKDLLKHDPTHKLGRITGLDPANPGFNYDSPLVRLDKTDAHFVDVIHTDAKTLLVVASGLNRDIGHADYYPNGGASQPGCCKWNSDSSIVSAVTDMTVCDHVRAPKLFMNSINVTEDCDFAAYRCSSYEKFKAGHCSRCKGKKSKKGSKTRCNKMGYWAKAPNTKKQVKYYLQTSEAAPFCAKHYQVQLHWRKGPCSSKAGFRGSIFVTLHGEKGSTKEFALNEGVTFNIVPGKTSRFLVSLDCSSNIGNIDRVTFRWERPTCWTYFFCSNENVYLKRVKIYDLISQKRSIFLPLNMDRDGNGRKDIFEVPDKKKQDLFRKNYIRARHPLNLNKYAKTRKPIIIPGMVQVTENQAHKGRLLERISNQQQNNSNIDHSQKSEQLINNSSNTSKHET